jgi:hypothetical protein
MVVLGAWSSRSSTGTASIHISTSPQKVLFFLRNDATLPLPVFMGDHPISQLNWGYRVAKKDLRKLQPLHMVIQQLRQVGLMSVHLLWTFFSLWIQSLRQGVTQMQLYLGPRRPNRFFF